METINLEDMFRERKLIELSERLGIRPEEAREDITSRFLEATQKSQAYERGEIPEEELDNILAEVKLIELIREYVIDPHSENVHYINSQCVDRGLHSQGEYYLAILDYNKKRNDWNRKKQAEEDQIAETNGKKG